MFKVLSDILYNKRGNVKADKPFSLFLMQRWLSMYSPDIANIINNTTNKLYNVTENNEQLISDLFRNIIPKQRYKKINYIKKAKNDDKTEENKERMELIDILANNMEMSKKEIRNLIEMEQELINS